MKTYIHFARIVLLTFLVISCSNDKKTNEKLEIDKIVQTASNQYEVLYDSVQKNKDKKRYLPRSIRKNGTLGFISSHDWTSGFFPGSLWYLHRLTGDETWKTRAYDYTKRMDSVKFFTGNHDIGFMMGCSWGNMMKVEPSVAYDSVIVQSAESLLTRYRPKAGVIQSWNSGKKWNCPVIIDNMMNLELLFHASKITGDSKYYDVAVSHADRTIENHFRPDGSSYHVLNYDVETGEVTAKNTHQGYKDESAWARGQAWGLYGFTVAFRETGNKSYLNQAVKIASFLKNHTELPEDQVPYWDFDVEKTADTPRDASAAAITASAVLELFEYLEGDQKSEYLAWAKSIVKNLSSENYLVSDGSNKGFILRHSVGSLPHNSEIDSPLNYADYYFLESLFRLKQLNELQ